VGYSGGGGSVTVAEVGSQSIATRDFQRALQDQMTRMRQIMGESFTSEQARALGLHESVLQSLIQETLFAEGARKLGLVVDDMVASQEIRSNPRFRTAAGSFDRLQFDQALREFGFSEGQYVAELKRELLRAHYLSAIALGRDAPETLVETLYRHRNERRVAQVITLPHSTIMSVPEPSQADLDKYYGERAARFTAPEYRALTVVRMRPSDVIDTIEISDARIRDYYEDSLHEFSEPERRTIQQALFVDEKAARDAHARIAAKEDFEKVAKEIAGVDSGGLTLGTLAKEEVPIPELADAAFSLDRGGVSEPVQSPIGWHLVRVTDIQGASRRTLQEATADIRKRIAADMANETLYKLSAKFEDELGGGANLEQAAEALKLNVLKIEAADRNGRDPDGNGIEGLSPEIVRVAFETPQGSDSTLAELGGEGGYFIVHVAKVTPQAVKPLEEIKDQVATAWKAEERAKRAETIAKEMVEEIKSGRLLADVAKKHGAQLATTQPFTRTRDGLNTPLPAALVSALFKSPAGTPEMAPANEAHVIGVVSEVTAADPKADADALKRLEEELGSTLANDLSLSLATALRERLSVSIDRAALDSAF